MARVKKVVETDVVSDSESTVINDERIDVKLKDKKVKNLTVYLPYGYVEFKDGKANVTQQSKSLLTDMGVI